MTRGWGELLHELLREKKAKRQSQVVDPARANLIERSLLFSEHRENRLAA